MVIWYEQWASYVGIDSITREIKYAIADLGPDCADRNEDDPYGVVKVFWTDHYEWSPHVEYQGTLEDCKNYMLFALTADELLQSAV